jgi:hypothetical protein
MKRRTPKEKYQENLRKQQKILDEFTAHETEWANDLIRWYKTKKIEIPFDEYRACAFFINKEYTHKTGSLTLLYEMYIRCLKELPQATRENAFDILCFTFKMYAKVLSKGGYDDTNSNN